MTPVRPLPPLSDASVLILCGGKGRRLGNQSQLIPKVLMPVKGRPMLAHILDYLQNQGFEEFTLGTGHLSAAIESYMHKEQPAVKAQISNAGDEAGMLKRIHHARAHYKQHVVVVYGDTLVDLDYSDLVARHVETKAPATIVLGKIQNPFGVVTLDEATPKVKSFVEKPVFNYYIGCFIFNSRILDFIPAEVLNMPDGQGLVTWFQRLIRAGELHAYQHEGLQVTFNSVRELHDAEKALSEYYTLEEER